MYKKNIILVLVFTILGCATPVTSTLNLNNTYFHPEFSKIKIHDVGVLLFKNETNRKDITLSVTEKFISELNKRGWFVVHKITEKDLSVLEKIKRIDAVLSANILEYRDYEPLKFGIKIVITDLRTSETIWSIQHTFDCNDKDTVQAIKSYYERRVESTYPTFGYKLYTISMDKFLEFCFNQILDKLEGGLK